MASKELRERVRDARRARGLTQEQFAAEAGVGVRMYQNFEAGVNRPQPANLRRILRVAGIDPGPERIVSGDTLAVDGELALFIDILTMWLNSMDPADRTMMIHELTRRIIERKVVFVPMGEIEGAHEV